MDSVIIDFTRQGLLSPQSPDEDLASRLFLQSRALLRAAAKTQAEPDAAALLCHLAFHHFARGLLAAKGYRPAGRHPHRTVAALASHFLGGTRAAPPEELLEHWYAFVEEPDMPVPRLKPRAALRDTRRVLAALESVLLKEFPAFKKLFTGTKPTISPERAFRD
jgi:hypothetical protein